MNFFAITGIVLVAVIAGWVFLPFMPSFIESMKSRGTLLSIYLLTP